MVVVNVMFNRQCKYSRSSVTCCLSSFVIKIASVANACDMLRRHVRDASFLSSQVVRCQHCDVTKRHSHAYISVWLPFPRVSRELRYRYLGRRLRRFPIEGASRLVIEFTSKSCCRSVGIGSFFVQPVARRCLRRPAVDQPITCPSVDIQFLGRQHVDDELAIAATTCTRYLTTTASCYNLQCNMHRIKKVGFLLLLDRYSGPFDIWKIHTYDGRWMETPYERAELSPQHTAFSSSSSSAAAAAAQLRSATRCSGAIFFYRLQPLSAGARCPRIDAYQLNIHYSAT